MERHMIQPSQVFLCIEPVDMRWGMDRLSAYLQGMAQPPCKGAVYAFTNRHRSRLKLLAWDGNGVWLALRRLHQGAFRWPAAGDIVHQVNQQEWLALADGIEWQRLRAKLPDHWHV